jgi:hypothetical protein
MIKLKTKADLQRLIDEEILESLTLDSRLRRHLPKRRGMSCARTFRLSPILRVAKSSTVSKKIHLKERSRERSTRAPSFLKSG